MKKPTLSISFASGKGGVGKSNLALNIGYSLFKAQQRVLLADCDMGLANMDVLLGVAPEKNLHDILHTNTTLEETILPIKGERKGFFDLLPANSGMTGFVDLDPSTLTLICDKLNSFASVYDFLILDIGAGIASTALSLCAATDMRILIVTPEPTSLTDSYAFIKVMATKHNIKDFYILVNQVSNLTEAHNTFKRLAMACEHFLHITPHFLGPINHDTKITAAVIQQRPFVELFPSTKACKDCEFIAKSIQKIRDETIWENSTTILNSERFLPQYPVQKKSITEE